jgi:tetratricopeptide (TPR) repeat protein
MQSLFALASGNWRPCSGRRWRSRLRTCLIMRGDVSAVTVENLEDIEKPFHIRYDYTRKNFSGWQEHKITPPLPALGFGPGDGAEKPSEPFWAAAPGLTTYRASVKLPKGFTIEAPKDADLQDAFAAYSAHYAVKDDELTVERTMRIRQAKVAESQWAAYQAFSKGLREEQARFFSLVETGSERASASAEKSNAAAALVAQAIAAWPARNLDRVRELLGQAEQLNPTQSKLWGIYGALEMQSSNFDKAIADCRKEIYFHPEEIQAYQQLSLVLALKAVAQIEQDGAKASLNKLEPKSLEAVQFSRCMGYARLGLPEAKRPR